MNQPYLARTPSAEVMCGVIADRALEPVRVLIVGNDQYAMRLLQAALRELVAQIDVTRDWPPVHGQAGGGRYDVIVLDLPRSSDAQASCRRLRAGGVESPVIVLSARATADDIVAALNAGADACLHEPIRIEELRARIKSLMRRRHWPYVM